MRAPNVSLVRLAWLLGAVLASALVLASLPSYLAGFPLDLPVQASSETVWVFQWISIIASLITTLVSLCISAVLIWRKTNDRMAVFVSFYLLAYGPLMGGPLEGLSSYIGWGQTISVPAQTVLLTTPTIAFLCLFPNGQFIPRWTRWLTVLSILPVLATLYMPADEWTAFSTPRAALLGAAIAVLILAAIYAQVRRYRRISTPMERQQTKLVVFGLLIWIAYLALSSIPYAYTQNLPPGSVRPTWTLIAGASWWLSLAILPFSLSAAILRRRLFDIDLIIRRTLIYAVLTGLLVLVYFGSVIFLQQLFRALTGQSSEIAIIVSTLAIAALFVPLRRRIQDLIDRRFYRQKYDAQKVLAAFGTTVRDEVELDKLTGELLSVVGETMQPQSVQLWLRPTPKPQNREPGI